MDKTHATLERVGIALFGQHWLHQLAAALPINEKSLRNILVHGAAIPPGIWKDLERVCRERAGAIAAIADDLAGSGGGFQTQVSSAMRRPEPRR